MKTEGRSTLVDPTMLSVTTFHTWAILHTQQLPQSALPEHRHDLVVPHYRRRSAPSCRCEGPRPHWANARFSDASHQGSVARKPPRQDAAWALHGGLGDLATYCAHPGAR